MSVNIVQVLLTRPNAQVASLVHLAQQMVLRLALIARLTRSPIKVQVSVPAAIPVLNIQVCFTYFIYFSLISNFCWCKCVHHVWCGSLFLGVIIHQHLTWEDYIRVVRNKVSKSIGLLFRIRKHFLWIVLKCYRPITVWYTHILSTVILCGVKPAPSFNLIFYFKKGYMYNYESVGTVILYLYLLSCTYYHFNT